MIDQMKVLSRLQADQRKQNKKGAVKKVPKKAGCAERYSLQKYL